MRWSAVAGATGYNVQGSLAGGGPYTVVASGLTGTRLNHTGLSGGATYYYVVPAENANGESAGFAQVSATAK